MVNRTIMVVACASNLCGTAFSQDRGTAFMNGTTSGMLEGKSLQWTHSPAPWWQDSFGQSPAGSDVWVSTTVDYDIHIEDTGSTRQFRTVIEELEIAKNATVSGFNFWVRPYVQNGINGSFVNYGTFRGDGGEVRIIGTSNYGTIHASGGELEFVGDNFGTFLVTENSVFLTHVSDNSGPGTFSRNHGLIEIRGKGAIYQVDTSTILGQADLQSYWSNFGTLRVTDSGTARIGRMILSDLGIIERDSSARIEITGLFDLEGQTINADTFYGEAWITSGYPGTSGVDTGEITNGIIDLTGDWLRFGDYAGYITDSQIIGGDIVLDPAIHGEEFASLVIDDIDIVDGGIVLAENSSLNFSEQTISDGTHYYNQSITTLHNSGEQAFIGIWRRQLHLGEDALITGHAKFGIGSYSTRSIYNEGTILSTASSGQLDLYADTENHGLIMVQDNTMYSVSHIHNENTLVFDNATTSFFSLGNNSTLDIINGSTVQLTRDLILTQNSILTIDASSSQPTVTLFRTLELAGILNLQLDAITQDGIYQLFDADTTIGEFDVINVTGLLDGLSYAGLNSQTGTYTIIESCAADLTGDGTLDFFDVSEFLGAFASQDPIADFTGDGLYDFFDVSAFLTAFGNGCP